MNVLLKILKLTNQMISKSNKSPTHKKLTIKGFQRHQNYKILLSIFVGIWIDFEQWLVKQQIEGPSLIKIDESDIHGKLIEQGI